MIFDKTVKWYKAYYDKGIILTKEDLESYVANAKEKNIEWSK